VIEVAFDPIGVAPIIVGRDVFRVEGDGLAEVGDGAIEVAFGLIGVAAIEMRRGGGDGVGIESDGLVEVGDGAIVFTSPLIGVAAVVVGEREFGIEGDGLAIIGDSAIELAPDLIGIAALEVSSSRAGIRFDDFRAGYDDPIRRSFFAVTLGLLIREHAGRKAQGGQSDYQPPQHCRLPANLRPKLWSQTRTLGTPFFAVSPIAVTGAPSSRAFCLMII